MRLLNYFAHLRAVGVVTGGVIVHHYGSKLLDRTNTKYASAQAAETKERLEKLTQSVEDIKKVSLDNSEKLEALKKIAESAAEKDQAMVVSEVQKQQVDSNLDLIKQAAEKLKVLEDSKTLEDKDLDKFVELSKVLTDSTKNVTSVWDKITKPKKFLEDGIESFTQYLDSLTLFQESSLLNTILLVIILLTGIQITFIFFGNELIKYFQIDKRYPSLSYYIKLRNTLQKYYLAWNIFILSLVCFIGIFLNMYALTSSH